MSTWLSWSTGKDSAWALHVLRSSPAAAVTGLFTTVNAEFDRVAMHSTRWAIAEAQATAAGLPLHRIDLPWPCPNDTYERLMGDFVARARAAGVTRMAFGDLFLADIRHYREERLAGTGIEPVFPLWGRNTAELAHEMIDAGLEAHLTTIDPRRLDPTFAGRRFDRRLVAELPADVDPCGENGEFHTAVVAGPMFDRRIGVRPGTIVERDGFVFADLVPDAT